MNIKFNQIKLSIIIINYNSKSVLVNCLNSIFENHYPFIYELYVIDNASLERINDLEIKYPTVNFRYNESNIGYAAANNIGIKKSKGDYIILLNPDTIVNQNSFLPMINYLNSNADVGVVGCQIFNEQGEIERSTHSFPNLIKEFFHANEFLKSLISYDSVFGKLFQKYFNSKSLHSYWNHASVKVVDHVTGACMMVKREVIEKAGLLDEAFFLYNEEVEWSMRIKKAGYKSIFLPESSIIHLFGHSTKQQVQRQTVNYLLLERYRGMFYLFKKHYGIIKLSSLRLTVLQGFTLRLCINYLKNIFRKNKDLEGQIYYMKKILSLCFSNNFDWRT